MKKQIENPKEAYYFSHDANSRHDPKIVKMRTVYGTEGYGWYFMLVEILREQSNFKYKIDKYCYQAIAYELQCDCEKIEKFIDDCVKEFELFSCDGEYFWSESLNRRMQIKVEKSKKYAENAKKRWKKNDSIAIQSHSNGIARTDEQLCNSNAIDMQHEMPGNAIKGKEIKEKEIKERKETENVLALSSSSGYKEDKNPVLFTESPCNDIIYFKESLKDSCGNYDLDVYYEEVKNFSLANNRRILDWTAYAKNFIKNDNKPKYKKNLDFKISNSENKGEVDKNYAHL